MKTQNILALLLFVFVFSACEKDEIQLQDGTTEANRIVKSTDEEATPSNRDFTSDPTAANAEQELLRALQWASYLTARTLRDHPESRNEFNAQMTLDGIYDMNALLDVNGSYPHFSQEFRRVLLLYTGGRPDQENEPNRPLSGTGPTGASSQVEALEYIDYITQDQCLELYIPNGITSLSAAYSSTGHPLNNDVSNHGYLRLSEPYFDENQQLVRVVDINPFDDNYVQNNDNIIIARPDRASSGGFNTSTSDESPDCSYSQYNVNFDLFLDQ